MKLHRFRVFLFSIPLFLLATSSPASGPSAAPPLPDLDKRTDGLSAGGTVSKDQRSAVERLHLRLSSALVDFEPLTGAPKWIRSADGYLSGPGGEGKGISAAVAAGFAANDSHRAVKAFVQEHQALFGYGPDALAASRVYREYVTPSSGMQTTLWQQELDGIDVFEGVFAAHTTKAGELIGISSQFMVDPSAAANAGAPASATRSQPVITAQQAVVNAAGSLDETVDLAGIEPMASSLTGPDQRQQFSAGPFNQAIDARLVWLPMNPSLMRLCWEVTMASRARGETFRLLVDAQTGEVQVRRCLTVYLSEATYRVYTSDSPSPFSPGWSTPNAGQPALTNRVLVTWSALDTNASPNGWIDDGVNETIGNNVDAHTDRDANNLPDLPRPQGVPFRVFDYPMDLTQSPATYTNAAVVQLFYWCNYMHDRLYELGFTEAAGNFQNNNFGRGGLGNDAVQADAQDGSGFNNANFTPTSDGTPPRIQMYLFNGPVPNRDGDFDAEVVLHEYTHGLSSRLVGGGVGISASQTGGMGEGWSDFYALALLSEPGDDVNGVYAAGGYVTYQLSGMTQNYYFGIRRYPYCTDVSKNPLTFKDIDPAQASAHPGIPRSPIIGNTANEVHNMGEVWCMTLREARANLINKYGWAVGNQLILQLVTDGMKLSPANPNFLQARDAILQADQVDNGGADLGELWLAFAKRGMGASATSPSSSTTTGVQEAFDVPDNLHVSPSAGLSSSGQVGGPFSPACQTYWVSNIGTNALVWTAWTTQPWVSVSVGGGSLSSGSSNSVDVCLTAAANALGTNNYTASVIFSNTVSGISQIRNISLYVSPPRVLFFPLDTDPGWSRQGQWAFGKPAGLGGTSHGHPDPASGATGTNVFGVNLSGDYSITVGGPYYLTAGPFDFSGYNGIKLQFQRWLNTDYPPYVYTTVEISTNGTAWTGIWSNTSGVEIADATWTRVSYDISAYADGRTNVYVRWGHNVVSSGAFAYSGWNLDDIEFIGNPTRNLSLSIPATATEGAGTLTGTVTASAAPTNDLVVALNSSDTSEATVPANVTIPAGQTNAVFNLTIVDDGVLDGPQTANITAAASGYGSGNASITVLDNETAVLSVLLPATATEGQGAVPGTVQVSAVPAANITVGLSSSDTTEIQVPASVIIPAGQTSAVFTATVVDDNQIDGPQTATVTAHVQNWTDGNTGITVFDNENLNLTLTLPANALESTGVLANAGSVGISGTLTSNLVVSLASDNPSRLTVPSTATILAGQISSAFSLTLVDNSIHDGNQIVKVTASASGFTNGTNLVLVVDDDVPPTITGQPTNQTVYVGTAASFSVLANGKSPLNYQWSFGGTNLAGATNATLTLTNVQLNQAGNYAVLVTNFYGSILSSNAMLTVNPLPPCANPPAGLIGWWKGDGNTLDSAGTNNGVLQNDTYTGGMVDQAFACGSGGRIQMADSPAYQLTNALSIECWIRPRGNGYNIFWRGDNRSGLDPYVLSMQGNNELRFYVEDEVGGSAFVGTNLVYNQWYHVAGTWEGATGLMRLYVNGQLVSQANTMIKPFGVLNPNNNPAISIGNIVGGEFPFVGDVDEVSLYNRALASNEVVSIFNAGINGKCVAVPPTIYAQPADQAVVVGGTANFSVAATGMAPLNYQWRFGGTNIAGATNATLTLTNVQFNQAGNYTVLVTNLFGSMLSSNAALVVGAHHFVWSQISSPQFVGSPFAVTVVAKDANNGTIINFAGTVTLYGMTTNRVGTNMDFEAGTLSPWTTLNVGNQPGPYDLVTYDVNGDGVSSTAFRIAANSGTPDGITQNVQLTGGTTYTVKMDIATDDLNSGNNADGGTTAILIGGATVAQFGWGSVNIGNIYRTNLTGTFTPPSNGVYAVTLTFYRGFFEPGNLWCLADDLRISSPGTSASISPTVSGNFTNGIWNGNITVMNQATNVVLVADDGQNHLGLSNPFNVLVPPVVDHFTLSPIPSPRFVNTPFAVSIQARNLTNGLFTNFTGTAILDSTNGVVITPPVSGNFIQGTWTGSVVIAQTASNLVLRASDGLGHLGLANAINVIGLPRLTMLRSGNIAMFIWPIGYSGFVLEASGRLSPATWVVVPYSPVQIGDQYLLPLDMTNTNGFYRLWFPGN